MPKAKRTSKASPDARLRKMRAIHAACRRLNISDDGRREIQQELLGQSSMSKMSEADLGKLLSHLNRNWKGSNPSRPHIAKIKALWWSLYWLGSINDPGDAALSTFVQRQTGISHLRFLDHRLAPSVIEALKSWLFREGVNWDIEGERWAIISCLARKLNHAGILPNGISWSKKRLNIQEPLAQWTPVQCDNVIRLLGKLWREKRGQQ